MLLLKATEDFVIGGRPYSDFPILLWDDMTGCEPVNQFFRHYLLRGPVESKHTWVAAGQALYDYFSFLQANNLAWDGVLKAGHKDSVAAYRDYSRDEESHTRATLRLRLSFIIAFYEYCARNALITHLPFSYEAKLTTSHSGFLAHAISSTEVVGADVMPKADHYLPRFLSQEQVKHVLSVTKNPHHRMMIQFALQTGLRRAEIATFPLSALTNVHGLKVRNVRVELDPAAGEGQKTKGRKRRTVWFPVSLMQDLHYYVKHHRDERARLSTTIQKPLFLNSMGHPFSEDGKALSRLFREIGDEANLHLHPHLLRHTYATHTLVALQRNPQLGIDPLVFLQRQLGHASINTTMVYLHIVQEMADDAVLQYQDELSVWRDNT